MSVPNRHEDYRIAVLQETNTRLRKKLVEVVQALEASQGRVKSMSALKPPMNAAASGRDVVVYRNMVTERDAKI